MRQTLLAAITSPRRGAGGDELLKRKSYRDLHVATPFGTGGIVGTGGSRRRRACPHLSEKIGGVTPPRTPQAAIPPGLPAKNAVSAPLGADKPPDRPCRSPARRSWAQTSSPRKSLMAWLILPAARGPPGVLPARPPTETVSPSRLRGP